MKKQVKRVTVKQGRRTFTLTSTIDSERNVETRELVMKSRRHTERHTFEIDLTTGKLLPPPGLDAPVEGSIRAALEQAVLTFTSATLLKNEAIDHE